MMNSNSVPSATLRPCPVCGGTIDPYQLSAMPFCSIRCKQIDLGRWLNEDVRMPVDPSSEFDDEEHLEMRRDDDPWDSEQ